MNKITEMSTVTKTATTESVTMATDSGDMVTMETELTTMTTTTTTMSTSSKVTVNSYHATDNEDDVDDDVQILPNSTEKDTSALETTENSEKNDEDTKTSKISDTDFKSLLPRIKAKVLQPGEEIPAGPQGTKTMMVINKDGTKTVLTVMAKPENTGEQSGKVIDCVEVK